MITLKPTVIKIESNKNVKLWLNGKSENTKQNYLNALAEFCIANNIEPEYMIKTIKNEQRKPLPTKQRSTNEWFNNYIKYCKDVKKSPNSIQTRITIVKGFIKSNRIDDRRLDSYFIPDNPIKTQKNKEKEVLSRNDIKKLIDISKSLKIKAIILSQVSSGLSTSNLIKLQVKDFEKGITKLKDKNKNLRKICKLPIKKQNHKYVTFLSEEAVKAIENYLNIERKNYKSSEPLFSKSKNTKKKMSSQGLQEAYRRLNRILGWDNKKGKSRKATSRSIQIFFKTQMINSGINDSILKNMMGYKVSYPINEKQLIKNYLEHMDSLTIGPRKPPVSLSQYQELKKANEELYTDIGELVIEVEGKGSDPELQQEYKEMKNAYENMVALNRAIEIRMNSMEERYKKLEEELKKLKQNSN